MEKQVMKQTTTLQEVFSRTDIKKRFEEILGKKSAGFISSVLSAVNTNPYLKQCEPMSVVSSAAIAASLDLPINQNLGFAYIIPYKDKAQMQIGYRGFIQLAMRTGQYKTINASVVCEGELVEHNKFTGEMEFSAEGKISDKIIGYVAYFKLINGFEKYYYMTTEEIDKHAQRYSQAYKITTSLWHTQKDVMALKTVLKLALSKYGILSIEMEKAIMFDQAVIKEDGTPEYVDNIQKEEKPAVQLDDVLKEKPEPQKPMYELPPEVAPDDFQEETETLKPKSSTTTYTLIAEIVQKLQKYEKSWDMERVKYLANMSYKKDNLEELTKQELDSIMAQLIQKLNEYIKKEKK